VVWVEGRGSSGAVFHALCAPGWGAPPVTRCGLVVSGQVPVMQRDGAKRSAVACAACFGRDAEHALVVAFDAALRRHGRVFVQAKRGGG